MDADGEDCPEHVPALLARFRASGGRTAIFAARARRLEGPAFRFGYALFRMIHRMLVGFGVRIGNFSVLAREHVATLVVSPDLWSHFAATAVKLRIPLDVLALNRGKRFAGSSRMNYVSLVSHGLTAISVFGEVAATRILIFGVSSMVAIALICTAVAVAYLFGARLPLGWTAGVLGFLCAIVMNALIAASVAAFTVTSKRDQLGFLPLRDVEHFIREMVSLYEHNRVRL